MRLSLTTVKIHKTNYLLEVSLSFLNVYQRHKKCENQFVNILQKLKNHFYTHSLKSSKL